MKKTALHDAHQALGAKMAEFAGYDMPIQYPEGVLTEHNWTRENAGLFDVSHMGQILLEGPEGSTNVSDFLEKLTPSTFSTLKNDACKYTVLTNAEGGIIDDLIVTRRGENSFFAVINAGCKDKDIAWIQENLPSDITLTHFEERSLIALQGPKAEQVLREFGIESAELGYMRIMETDKDGETFFVSRLGYTGEDGFEISVPSLKAEETWNALAANEAVKPVGLAARDSLRLEMGYPLYGHDIDDTTSPVEADIVWVMGKRTNTGFIGAERVLRELKDGTSRRRVGIKLTGKGIAREETEIFSKDGQKIGVLTSGGFSPTLQEAIGQGYVDAAFADGNQEIAVKVRGRDIAAKIEMMPFVAPKTKTAKKAAA